MAYTINRRLSTLVDSNGQLNTGKIPNDYITGDHIADNVITSAMLHTSFTVSTSNLTAIDTDDVSEGSSNLYYTDARARGAISVSGNALSYNSSTGVITSNYEESPTFTGTVTVTGEIVANGGIALGDNDKATFGDSDDLEIFHTGNSSIIADKGTGSLSVRGTNLNLADSGGNIFIEMTDTGTGGTVEIKHNASTKLTTTSTGIDVTGTVTADGLTVSDGTETTFIPATADRLSFTGATFNYIQTTSNLQIAPAGDLVLFGTSAEIMRLKSGKVGIGTTNPSHKLHVAGLTKLNAIVHKSGSLVITTGSGDNYIGTIETFGNGDSSGATLTIYDGHYKTTRIIYLALQNASGTNSLNYSVTGGGGTTDIDIQLKYINRSGAANKTDFYLASSGGKSYTQVYSWEAEGLIEDTGHSSTGASSIDLDDKISIMTLSNGNVGIRTNYPTEELHVYNAGNTTVQIQTSGGGVPTLKFASPVGTEEINANVGSIRNMVFRIGGSERARIDSSGNLLVGKTASDLGVTAGIELNGQYDVGYFTRSGEKALVVNRLSTDGTIADFRKDGTSVGSIGTRSTGLIVGNGDVGLHFDAQVDRIFPESPSSGSARDNAIDLGTSAARFKTLYLSNTLYIGSGTGTTTSYISDYEDDLYIYNKESAGKLFLGTNNSTKVTIDSSGNVGIGTGSPFVKLAVSNNGAEGIELIPSGGGEPIIQSYNRSGSAFTPIRLTGSDLKFHTGSSPSEAMRIDASGRVGIGTSSPSQALEIAGSVRIDNGASFTAYEVYRDNILYGSVGGASNQFTIQASNNKDINIFDDSGNGLTVKDGGNVGIGTSSPDQLLQVGSESYGANAIIKTQVDGSDVGNFDSGLHMRSHDDNFGGSIVLESRSGTNDIVNFKYHNNSSAGATAMAIDTTNGNVGIGTSSPTEDLTIASTSPQIRFEDTDASGTPYSKVSGVLGNIYIQADDGNEIADSKIDFRVDGTQRMVIDSSGNVGINTSSPTAGVKLHVTNATQVNQYLESTGNATNSILQTGADGNSAYVFNRANAGLTFGTNNTERLRIDSSGNLLVNTTSQYGSQKLSVNGGIAIDGRSAATPGLCEKSDTDTGIFWPTTNTLGFSTAGAERMRIDSSGNLLVGMTSTGSTGGMYIDQTGNVVLASANINSTETKFKWTSPKFNAGSQSKHGIQLFNGTSDKMEFGFISDSGGNQGSFLDTSNTDLGTIIRSDSNGVRLANGATSWSSYSDSRLKDVTGEIPNALDKIDAMRGVLFSWNDDEENTQRCGVIAQEVQAVLPEVVDTDTDYLQVRYTEMIPLLIQGIKEQQDIITQLTARLEALENA